MVAILIFDDPWSTKLVALKGLGLASTEGPWRHKPAWVRRWTLWTMMFGSLEAQEPLKWSGIPLSYTVLIWNPKPKKIDIGHHMLGLLHGCNEVYIRSMWTKPELNDTFDTTHSFGVSRDHIRMSWRFSLWKAVLTSSPADHTGSSVSTSSRNSRSPPLFLANHVFSRYPGIIIT